MTESTELRELKRRNKLLLRTHRDMNFRRDWCRVRGAGRTHTLVTFGLVGVNVRLLRDWYTTHGQADPWMLAIGDTSDPDFSLVHARRTAKPRGKALHVRVTTGDIPRRTEPAPGTRSCRSTCAPSTCAQPQTSPPRSSPTAPASPTTPAATPPHQPG